MAASPPVTHPDAPKHERFPVKPGKTYGLMCVVPTRTSNTGTQTEKQVQAWPAALSRELVLFFVTLAVLSIVALLFAAPLEEPANPLHPPNPAKAPWYFLGLQEMVSYSAFWGGIGIPGLMVGLLFLVPYMDRNPQGVGKWFAKERRLANTIFLTMVILNVIFFIICTFFRGPNWEFDSPF